MARSVIDDVGAPAVISDAIDVPPWVALLAALAGGAAAGLVGAIVLTLRHKANVKRQDINVQNARTPELAMSVRKVASGQGLQDSDAAEWVK